MYYIFLQYIKQLYIDQLLSANDDTYTYDSRGNITSKTVGNTVTNFTYANTGWKDLLVSVDDTELEYDANGNVILYGDREFTWTYGRSLASVLDGMDEYTYTYDENGIRTSKTVDGVTTYYNTKDGVILSQTDGENTWYFQYDTSGTPLGFVLNGTQYFYITNQMNDVLAITDTNGDIVGNYEYDAWGKVLTADTDLAKQNPLRYRGYYYDNETGYYYLQSRYYDSNICRFINADSSAYLLGNNVELNLFSYCQNDSINRKDIYGNKSSNQQKKTYVFMYNGNSSLVKQAKFSYYYNYYSKNVVAFYVKTFDDFKKYWNSMTNIKNIYLYFHGGTGVLYFGRRTVSIYELGIYLCKKRISGSVYLFSCKGGMGAKNKSVAYKISQRCYGANVYASMVGVSYTYSYKGYYARIEAKYLLSSAYYTYWMRFRTPTYSDYARITNLWVKSLK